jgi:hypothetical protein
VLDKQPWVARALHDAFTKAKAPYLDRLRRGEGQAPEDLRYRSLTPLLGDPLPYGMAANRASIEALMTYALQQKLIPARTSIFRPRSRLTIKDAPRSCPSSTSTHMSLPPTTRAIRCSRSAAIKAPGHATGRRPTIK